MFSIGHDPIKELGWHLGHGQEERTKEVRTHQGTEGDPGRYGRCAAIQGRAMYSGTNDVLLRISKNLYSRTRYSKIPILPTHSAEI